MYWNSKENELSTLTVKYFCDDIDSGVDLLAISFPTIFSHSVIIFVSLKPRLRKIFFVIFFDTKLIF